MPTVGNVLRSMWERGWSFIKKAGTIILLSTIVLWFLMRFGWVDGSFGMLDAEMLDSSILASLEWGDWKMAVAAYSFLVFNLLCAPCFSGLIKRLLLLRLI